MRKNLFKVITILLTALMLMSIVTYAAEEDSSETFTDTELPGEAVPDSEHADDAEMPGEEEKSDISFRERLSAFFESGKFAEYVGMLASAAMFGVAILLKNSVNVFSNMILSAFSANQKSVTESTTTNKADVQALESKLAAQMSAISEKEEEMLKLLREPSVTAERLEKVCEAIKTLGEMFDTIYQGSSTIPAAIKEREAKKFNHIVEVISGDAALQSEKSEEADR